MNESRKHTKNGKTRLLRLAGFPVGMMLAFAIAFVLAGAASARVAVAPANSSPPAISGTAQEGQTLTADKGAWTGTEPIVYTLEWQSCNSGGGSCATIKGATDTTYKLSKQEVGNTIRVVVTAKNADGSVSVTSVATAVAAAVTAEPTNSSPPTLSGTAQEGQTLTASKGTWTGTEPIAYTYAWQRCDSSGGHCSTIGGVTGTTYTLQKVDIDKTLRVEVSAKNAGGTTSARSGSTVVVKAAPVTPAPSVTLSASTLKVVYGTSTKLSGMISTKLSGENVTVLAQRYAFSDAKFSPVATVTTGTGGAWSYNAKPTIRTAYQAKWKSATSSALTIGVKPLVTFHVITGNRFSTKVVAARSFATRIVQFQRRSSVGKWVTLKQLRLNSTSTAIFRAILPKGTSTLRIAISVNQAGAGYLGGISRTITYHRA
jgi:hypothetical protein